MYDYRLREPHKLSGGQKQRVAIAGIIAMQTAVSCSMNLRPCSTRAAGAKYLIQSAA